VTIVIGIVVAFVLGLVIGGVIGYAIEPIRVLSQENHFE